MTKRELLYCLKESYIFSGVKSSGLLIILRHMKENTFAKGEVIFSEGDAGDSLHIITSGVLKVVKYSKDGKTKTLAILNKKTGLEKWLFTKEARSATVEALEETRTLSISMEDYEDVISKEPSISLQIIKSLSERLSKADRDIKILAHGDAKSRVACVLMDFKDNQNQVRFSHQEIGDLAGLSRETTTRVLNSLEKEGLVKAQHKSVLILDIKNMKELCI